MVWPATALLPSRASARLMFAVRLDGFPWRRYDVKVATPAETEARMHGVRDWFRGALVSVAAFAASAATAQADAIADFYKGKELRFIISATSGTGYDAYARAVGRHLSRHIPGNPAIVPQNMPGAGGIT